MSTRRSAKTTAPPQLPLANPWLAILAAWLLPGGGHFFLGRRGRGGFFFVLVLACLAIGVALGGHLPWQFEGSPLFILASIGTLGGGLPAIAVKLSGYVGDPTGAGLEYGRAFIITSGLMNWMLVLDTWDIAWGKELEAEDSGGAEEQSDGGEA
ncbi:MAG: DUF6677 family protein [Acidobacteriota bacterium]